MSTDFYDNQFIYGQTSKGIIPEHKFPQLLLLGDGVTSAILRRENSSWNLQMKDDILALYFKDKFVRIIELPERPKYFKKILTDGTPSESIIAVAGESTPGYFFVPDCNYYTQGIPCGFCGIKPTRNTVGKKLLQEFSNNNLREATRLFQNTSWRDIPVLSITTGTCKDDDDIRKRIIDPIRIVYETLDPKIPIHLLTHPPKNLSVIEEYKQAGVTTIAFNIEIYDRGLFEKTCPGKSKTYGYDEWITALLYARDIFGNYNVFCGFVWGLEPIQSTLEGNEHMLEQKISIASNVFHADHKSILRNFPHPSKEDIIALSKAQHTQYLRYPRAKTIFNTSMRSTLDYEIKRGDFNDIS